MTEDSLIYSFMLEYTPSPLRGVEIIRNLAITVNIQCHYPKSDFYTLFSCFFVISQSRMWFLVCVFQRTHDVSSGLLKPTWSPFSLTTVAEENLHFSLQLMTGGFVMESCSFFFFLLKWKSVPSCSLRWLAVPSSICSFPAGWHTEVWSFRQTVSPRPPQSVGGQLCSHCGPQHWHCPSICLPGKQRVSLLNVEVSV